MAWPPVVLTLARVVTPVARLLTNTSVMPLVSFSVTACLSGGPMSPRRATLGLMAVQQDYDAIWKEIEGSPLAGVYIRELYWLARTVVSALDRLFANGLGPNEMSPMHVSGRMNDDGRGSQRGGPDPYDDPRASETIEPEPDRARNPVTPRQMAPTGRPWTRALRGAREGRCAPLARALRRGHRPDRDRLAEGAVGSDDGHTDGQRARPTRTRAAHGRSRTEGRSHHLSLA